MGIKALIGPPGSGKSYLLARQAFAALAGGRDVYSNFRVNEDWVITVAAARGLVRGNSYIEVADQMGRWHPIQSFEELAGIQDGVFLFDEAHLWAFSRNYRELPFQAVFWWSQSRKFGVDVFFATQRWASVDATLRDLAHERIVCRRFAGGFAYRIEDPSVERKASFISWRYVRFDPVIAQLYNTREILTPPGWEQGSARQGAPSRRGRSARTYQPRPLPGEYFGPARRPVTD